MKKIIRIILVIVVVLVVVWLVVALLVAPKKKANDKVSVQETGEVLVKQQKETPPPSPVPQLGVTDEQQHAQQVAKIVAERFGTYSSHAQGANIDEILPLLSDLGKQWAERYRIQNSQKVAEYSGVTTKAASAEFLEWLPAGTAVVRVHASRIVTDAKGNEKTNLQNALVSLSKIHGKWLVNEVRWE